MRLIRFSFVVVALIALACVVAAQTKPPAGQTAKPAAAAPQASNGKPRTVEIVGTDDMKYSVTRIPAARGEQLRIRLISKGTLPKIAMAHNVVVLKLGTNELKFITAGATHRATDFIAPEMKDRVLAATPFAGPGETVDVTFKVPDAAGDYPYVCTFAGHFQAGMKGVLVVK